jgi:hypothetical protein
MDLPYTKPADVMPSTQDWDRAWTERDFDTVLSQIAAIKTGNVHVYIIKCHISDVTWLSHNLKERNYVIHPHVWEKIDQNIYGTHKIVPSNENIIVAISKETEKKESFWEQLPIDPLERHGFIIGNIVRSPCRDEKKVVVNRSQTPIYLSRILAQRYLPMGTTRVLNICMGSGSDVIGLASAGFDVIGVDNSRAMYDATTTRLMELKKFTADNKVSLGNHFDNGIWMDSIGRMDGIGAFGVNGWIRLLESEKKRKAALEDAEVEAPSPDAKKAAVSSSSSSSSSSSK